MDVEDDELPPLPHMPSNKSPKRVRRRARFSKDTIAASTLVPNPSPDQIISTLIDSLTAISQEARDQLKREFDADAVPPSPSLETQDLLPQTSFVDIPVRRGPIPDPNEEYDDSDGDVAVAPVVRFKRSPPEPKSKKSQKDRSGSYLTAMASGPSLSVRNSLQSLHSEGAPGSIGVLSIGRPGDSSTSQAASLRSARSLSRNNSEPAQQPSLPDPILPHRSATSTTKYDRTTARFSFEPEDDRHHWKFDTDATPPSDPPSPSQTENNESYTNSPVNAALGRGDLGNHLIPTRRSSRRSSSQSDSGEGYRHSTGGSRDLKDLNIDDDLIGSDDSTVRRIRELQEAREKRQSEWRKESRRSFDRSDRPGKRHSAPSPKAIHRTNTYQSSKLSVTEVLVESEQEASPDVSARVDASDLADMPALVVPDTDDGPVSPTSPTRVPQPPRSSQTTPTPTARALSAPPQNYSPSSARSVKRSSTISSRRRDSTLQSDVKSIQDEVDKFLAAPRLTQKIRHPRTGRTIAFSEVGDPDGFAVICCVGMGMTRYIMTFYDELARTLKLRLITPDRPGVGESESVPDRLQNPLTWVDDVAVICSTLEISRFSLLAHSAGSIYALATALKMPQFVRGRIHLLAPWIPPSQMPKGAAIGPYAQPVANLPMAHRVLSLLPASMLKVANSKFLSANTVTGEAKAPKSKKLRNIEGLDNIEKQFMQSYTDLNDPSADGVLDSNAEDPANRTQNVSCYQANNDSLGVQGAPPSNRATPSPSIHDGSSSPRLPPDARAALYNSALTHRIWALATLNANPAIDLLTCLERRKTIGFRYAEVTRSIVIRHGAKDSRVPLDNVRWLQSIMKRCELRVLEEEGHSLMASASVMSSVLSEIAREWDEWERIARDKEKRKRGDTTFGKENKAMSLRSLGTISVKS